VADFFYSLDGKTWIPLGTQLKMAYTVPHFMGKVSTKAKTGKDGKWMLCPHSKPDPWAGGSKIAVKTTQIN
jgi:hypothetical protein